MNIELANGSEGYIPPPEQHALGGYTTWPARTAGLEVQAEPKIVAAVLQLLEQVAGKPRRVRQVPKTPYAEAVLASKPLAYWRLDDIEGTTAIDSSGHGRHASLRGRPCAIPPGRRCPRALGRRADQPRRSTSPAATSRPCSIACRRAYTVELWFWSGLSEDAGGPGSWRALGAESVAITWAERFRAGGGLGPPLRCLYVFRNPSPPGRDSILGIGSRIPPRTWRHLAWVRDGRTIKVYLDGGPKPDIAADTVGRPRRGTATAVPGRIRAVPASPTTKA